MQNESSERTPQTVLYGIGAQKAGTTWLFKQLEKLEDVYLAKPKELHYWDVVRPPYFREYALQAEKRLHAQEFSGTFSDRFPAPLRKHLSPRESREKAKYLSLYGSNPFDHSAYARYLGLGRPSKRMVADITPSYALLDQRTYGEMFHIHDSVKFIFIMRDPVDRLWSGIKQFYRREILSERMNGDDLNEIFSRVCESPHDHNFQRSDYQKTILELEAVVPTQSVHYCFFENLIDPDQGNEEREKLEEFLEIPSDVLDFKNRVHESKKAHLLGESEKEKARTLLQDNYNYLQARFRGRIPYSWMK